MAKRVIRCPIDWLTFAKGDTDAVMTSQQVRNHAILNYTVPPKYIEPYLHRRFRCETFTAASGQEQALVTVSACTFQPQSTSVLQRWIDPPLLSSVSYQVLVRDQVTWQRSSWQFATFLRSFFFSRIPRTVYGLPLFHVPVQIETQFNVDHNKYDSYSIHCEGTVDGIGTLEIDLNDTGVQLLHPKTRILDGFDHNESALATLAYNNEYVTRGEGNWLYRQTVLGNPFHPNRAELKATPRIDYLVRTLGLPITLNEPHSIFLQDDVGTIHSLQLEAHIEDDNEPHSGSQMPGASGPSGGIHDRIQRKAMNRYTSFRDDLRSKILTEKKDNPETEPHRTPPS